MATSICLKCAGTVLPPSQSGALRGTCHCQDQLPGSIYGRRRMGDALQGEPPVVWMYRVQWNGRTCAPVWSRHGEAQAYLEGLRDGSITPTYLQPELAT